MPIQGGPACRVFLEIQNKTGPLAITPPFNPFRNRTSGKPETHCLQPSLRGYPRQTLRQRCRTRVGTQFASNSQAQDGRFAPWRRPASAVQCLCPAPLGCRYSPVNLRRTTCRKPTDMPLCRATCTQPTSIISTQVPISSAADVGAWGSQFVVPRLAQVNSTKLTGGRHQHPAQASMVTSSNGHRRSADQELQAGGPSRIGGGPSPGRIRFSRAGAKRMI